MSWAVRIRCPVDEMGRNSVTPSTTPMTSAFGSSSILEMSRPPRLADWRERYKRRAHYQPCTPIDSVGVLALALGGGRHGRLCERGVAQPFALRVAGHLGDRP